MKSPVFRFAPSPNGALHLGHAYSALLNAKLADASAGRLLLRIEDIDITRCTPEFEAAIYDDLKWLDLSWEEPVRRQSDHFREYEAALQRLARDELVYPSFMSRGEIRAFISDTERRGRNWPSDPDGAPLYPGVDKTLSSAERNRRIEDGEPFAWRLDMDAALKRVGGDLYWTEFADQTLSVENAVAARPESWGDVIIARRDIPTSYHLSVVVDDALQDITHVVRGRDLFFATGVQRLLQQLLGLPAPRYFHHELILGADGRKLSKSSGDTGLSTLRDNCITADEIRQIVGL